MSNGSEHQGLFPWFSEGSEVQIWKGFCSQTIEAFGILAHSLSEYQDHVPSSGFLHPSTFLTGSYKMPSSPLHASLHIFISMLIGAIIQPTFFCYKLQEINTQTNQRQKWDEAQGSHGCNVHTATSSEVDTREITNRFLFNRGKQCSMWLPKMHVIMS